MSICFYSRWLKVIEDEMGKALFVMNVSKQYFAVKELHCVKYMPINVYCQVIIWNLVAIQKCTERVRDVFKKTNWSMFRSDLFKFHLSINICSIFVLEFAIKCTSAVKTNVNDIIRVWRKTFKWGNWILDPLQWLQPAVSRNDSYLMDELQIRIRFQATTPPTVLFW